MTASRDTRVAVRSAWCKHSETGRQRRGGQRSRTRPAGTTKRTRRGPQGGGTEQQTGTALQYLVYVTEITSVQLSQ